MKTFPQEQTSPRWFQSHAAPRLVSAARSIKADSFLIDGEGIVYDGKGMPSFDLLHSHEYDREVSLLAFDVLEFSSTEVRKQPLV